MTSAGVSAAGYNKRKRPLGKTSGR